MAFDNGKTDTYCAPVGLPIAVTYLRVGKQRRVLVSLLCFVLSIRIT